MDTYSFLKKSQKIVDEIDQSLIKYIPEEPKEFTKACETALTGGKHIRGIVGVYSCLAVGGKKEAALPIAVSIELAHSSSLVADDFIDKDELRRGKPSIHTEFGRDIAILTSSYLLGCSYEAFYDLVKKKLIPIEVFLKIIDIAHQSVMSACVGEAMDIISNGAMGIEEYLKTVGKKTGEAFRVAAEIGAIIGETSNENNFRKKLRQLSGKADNGGKKGIFRQSPLAKIGKSNTTALSDYGKYLGLSFQIRDDILDVIGTEELLGKPILSDMTGGRSSVVLELSILEHMPEDKLNKLKKMTNIGFEDIEEVKHYLKESNTLDYAQNLAEEYVKKAKSALINLDDSEYKSMLLEIADFAVDREL